jgi:hypothetical protein
MTNTDRTPDPIAAAMKAASDRRLADRATFTPNAAPARRLPPKSRRHSVKHRALR